MDKQIVYDYIITGGGAAGLLLALRFAEDTFFDKKQILIIEASAKNTNDRTWCFWSAKDTFIQEVVSHQWEKVVFASDTVSKVENIQPYIYNHVKALDFYTHVRTKVQSKSNITWLHESVKELREEENLVYVDTDTNTYAGRQVFNSILFSDAFRNSAKYPLINQHFIGWKVKLKEDLFDPNTATFMDFDIPQQGNTRFMYVLPTSKNEALFEYTLFSHDLLPKSAYEAGIKSYLQDKGITTYEIVETEAGCIPMTCYPFWDQNTRLVHHIGIAGGWAKASTGYTFHNSLIKTKQIVDQLKSGQQIGTKKRDRFWFYDLLLLDNLYRHNEKGGAIFSAMFQRNSFQEIFAFLDESTTFWQELKTIWGMPKGLFIKALLRRIF